MAKYYMLNKPLDYITARRDPRCKAVMDLFPEEFRDILFPVGRLDKDTEGLLLITDDGALNHYLLSPENRIEKTYLFYAVGQIDDEKLSHLEYGARVFPGKDSVTLPARVNILGTTTVGEIAGLLPAEYESLARRKPQKVVTYGEVTVTEGKKHQVKHMIAYAGGKIVYLKRLAMGGLKLDENLKSGEYRSLMSDEILLIQNRTENV